MAKAVKMIAAPAAQAATGSDGTMDYIVAEKAPPRVAGRRVKAGETIRLTEEQARSELLALHILPAQHAADPET